MGLAIGGVFFEHAPTITESRTTITINECARLFIANLNLILRPWHPWHLWYLWYPIFTATNSASGCCRPW